MSSHLRLAFVTTLLLVACGGSAGDSVGSPASAPPATGPGSDGAASSSPATPGAPTSTTTPPSSSSGGPTTVSAADGTATRVACTSSFGSAMSTTHGRLDGYLVSIVPPNTHTCNGDSTHVHLQVKSNNSVYDVAVNVDGIEAEADAALPGPAWSEGWHAGEALDYPQAFALHSSSFTLTGIAAVRQRVETELANANHVAIYTTGYGPTGGHLVHRQGSGRDGAIVIDPLGAKPHVLAFRFDTQTF